MTTPNTTTDKQSGELAGFLSEHPDFTPVFSDDAVLCGFRVGASSLSLDNVQGIFYYSSSTSSQGAPERAAPEKNSACVRDGLRGSEASLATVGEK